MNEIWKTIDGFKDYQISNYGRVKSLKNKCHIILKPSNNGIGYLFINLCKNNIKFYKFIHRLVALTFIPNPENKPCVNHKNGNKENNHVDNLEWCTHSENMKHAYDIGIREISKGNKSPNHKLSENQVLSIHNLYLLGNSQYKISKIYNVSRSCIEHIVNGITWKELNKIKGK